jgi:hypothetical protein
LIEAQAGPGAESAARAKKSLLEENTMKVPLIAALVLAVGVLGYLENSAAQQVLAKEQAAGTVVIEAVRLQGASVSGELHNRLSRPVRDVELLIRHVWMWKNEFRPGTDDPGTAVVYTLQKEIPPGGKAPFSHEISTPLPDRPDGLFETVVSVAGFTEIIPQ